MKKRYVVLFLLVVLSILTFLDRLAIAVAGPRIQNQLHISSTAWGWILGAFVLSCGIFEIPSGAMGDRRGQRLELTRIVAWWSLFTSLTGACRSFWQLLVVRFLFGVGEAGAYPNASGVISRWFPKQERARAQSFVWAASRLGGMLAPLLLVPMETKLGWRAIFGMLGVLGGVWAIAWWSWFHDRPSMQPGIQPQELAEIGEPKLMEDQDGVPWRRLLTARPLWLIAGAYWCYAWGSWFYFAWFPTWLVRGAGFSEAQMGIFAALPFACGIVGNLVGGVMGDGLARARGVKIARRTMLTASLLLSSVLLLCMSVVHGHAAVVVVSSIGFGVMDLMLPSAWALCLDVGGSFAGTVTGVMNTAGQFGGLCSTILFGYVVRMMGNYHAALWVIAAMVCISGLLFSQVDASQPLLQDVEEAF